MHTLLSAFTSGEPITKRTLYIISHPMKLHQLLAFVAVVLICLTGGTSMAQTTVTIGMGSSSSSTRGPFQRSDTNSTTVFSRFVQTYTAAELAAAGITNGVSISAVNWELASSNVIIGNGDATLKVYIKNSSSTAAVADTWTNLISGSSLVVDNIYNTSNNFPGANGWMPFTFSSPFVYTGGAVEIAVDWDCSQVSTPAFSGDGSIKWRWESTAPDDLVAKKTSSSSPSSTISDLRDERANIQFVVNSATAISPVTIGMGSSSSSTRGPFQRSDTNSSTVFSRFVQTYTAAELAAAGMTSGISLTAVNWELASSNVMIGTGDATLKVYIKNSSATTAVADTWTNLISGSSLVVDNIYNTGNNFPGANGWMPFTFSTPFVYTGGALEIAVDWDCSQVSTPAFSGDGSLKWRWESTAPDDLVAKKTSSSSPSSTISDLRDERANIQFVFSTAAVSCDPPSMLTANNITPATANLSWTDSSGTAVAFNWLVVDTGAGITGPAVDAGSSSDTFATATGLAPMTVYDFYVASDCGTDTSAYAGPFTFTTLPAVVASSPVTIGMGSSSSSTRGPFQRSDTNSTTVFSRFVHVYTAAELASAGITSGVSLTALNWELASSNVMIGTGDATLKVYIKNSSATSAVADSWTNLISGSSLVVDHIYNTTNNFPGANGWMPFDFSAPFVYTGGALEIAVDWDCSQVSTPAFSGDGSLKWRWESTAPDFLVVKKTASSAPSSNITDLRDERANIQFVFTSVADTCSQPTDLLVTNVTNTSADLSWTDTTASSYDWRIVLAGDSVNSTAIDSGMSIGTMANTTSLMASTSYDFYVQAVCDTNNSSGFAVPVTFTTACTDTPTTNISSMITDASCKGENDGAIDVTVDAGIAPFSFEWSTTDTTEDITGLMAGAYSLAITDGNGCILTANFMVSEPDTLVATATSVPDTADAGRGSVSIAVTGGTAPYTYTWDGSPGSADSTGLTSGTYTIMVTDANGCTDTTSAFVDNLVGISDINYISDLSISPNPASDRVSIDLKLSQSTDVHVSIYSLMGELVTSFEAPQTSQVNRSIDLSQYANGVYMIRFTINQQFLTQKLILQK